MPLVCTVMSQQTLIPQRGGGAHCYHQPTQQSTTTAHPQNQNALLLQYDGCRNNNHNNLSLSSSSSSKSKMQKSSEVLLGGKKANEEEEDAARNFNHHYHYYGNNSNKENIPAAALPSSSSSSRGLPPTFLKTLQAKIKEAVIPGPPSPFSSTADNRQDPRRHTLTEKKAKNENNSTKSSSNTDEKSGDGKGKVTTLVSPIQRGGNQKIVEKINPNDDGYSMLSESQRQQQMLLNQVMLLQQHLLPPVPEMAFLQCFIQEQLEEISYPLSSTPPCNNNNSGTSNFTFSWRKIVPSSSSSSSWGQQHQKQFTAMYPAPRMGPSSGYSASRILPQLTNILWWKVSAKYASVFHLLMHHQDNDNDNGILIDGIKNDKEEYPKKNISEEEECPENMSAPSSCNGVPFIIGEKRKRKHGGKETEEEDIVGNEEEKGNQKRGNSFIDGDQLELFQRIISFLFTRSEHFFPSCFFLALIYWERILLKVMTSFQQQVLKAADSKEMRSTKERQSEQRRGKVWNDGAAADDNEPEDERSAAAINTISSHAMSDNSKVAASLCASGVSFVPSTSSFDDKARRNTVFSQYVQYESPRWFVLLLALAHKAHAELYYHLKFFYDIIPEWMKKLEITQTEKYLSSFFHTTCSNEAHPQGGSSGHHHAPVEQKSTFTFSPFFPPPPRMPNATTSLIGEHKIRKDVILPQHLLLLSTSLTLVIPSPKTTTTTEKKLNNNCFSDFLRYYYQYSFVSTVSATVASGTNRQTEEEEEEGHQNSQATTHNKKSEPEPALSTSATRKSGVWSLHDMSEMESRVLHAFDFNLSVSPQHLVNFLRSYQQQEEGERSKRSKRTFSSREVEYILNELGVRH